MIRTYDFSNKCPHISLSAVSIVRNILRIVLLPNVYYFLVFEDYNTLEIKTYFLYCNGNVSF